MSDGEDNAARLMKDVQRTLRVWLGTEHVYSDYKPKKEACEITAYIKVYGMSFRIDWEYEVPLDIKRMPSAEKVVSAATEQIGKDIAGLWAAGPDRRNMMNYEMYGDVNGPVQT